MDVCKPPVQMSSDDVAGNIHQALCGGGNEQPGVVLPHRTAERGRSGSRCCSPCHGMPFHSMNEASKRI